MDSRGGSDLGRDDERGPDGHVKERRLSAQIKLEAIGDFKQENEESWFIHLLFVLHLLLLLLFFCVWVLTVYTFDHVPRVCVVPVESRRGIRSSGLELEMIGGCYIDARNPT